MKTEAALSLTIHPQAEKLRSQNRQLQAEAARLIVERDHLKMVVAPQIAAEYQSKIGALELRVFQFECEARAFIRRIELATAGLNHGEKPAYRQIERQIRTEFAAWREKIEQQIREIKAAKESEELPLLTVAESRGLKVIYRRLALLLHPDVVRNPTERQQKLWRQTAEAYRNGDLQILRTINLLVGDESESPENDAAGESLNILESLQIRNQELKRICEKFLDEIAEIKTSAPYILHKILGDQAELEKCQNNLRAKIEALRERRRQLVEHWMEIMRCAENTETIQIPEEPPEIFTSETDDWAEIIYEF